jgi:PPOX class probable F420-dependent enzyme
MTKPPVPSALHDFLSQPNPSVIATLTADGSPHTAATWYLWEDGRVLVNMAHDRKRLEHMRRDPRVAITIVGPGEEWDHQLTLRGHVAAIDDDGSLADIDRIARHYTGDPFARRQQQRVSAWIEVDSWYGWAGGAPWTGSR